MGSREDVQGDSQLGTCKSGLGPLTVWEVCWTLVGPTLQSSVPFRFTAAQCPCTQDSKAGDRHGGGPHPACLLACESHVALRKWLNWTGPPGPGSKKPNPGSARLLLNRWSKSLANPLRTVSGRISGPNRAPRIIVPRKADVSSALQFAGLWCTLGQSQNNPVGWAEFRGEKIPRGVLNLWKALRSAASTPLPCR